jgi:hypothetical protein
MIATTEFSSGRPSGRTPRGRRLSGAELAEHLRRKNREKAVSKARRSRRRGR